MLSCSTDSDEIQQEIENNQPNINFQALSIDEHSEPGSVIGTITATNSDMDDLTFSIKSESGLAIDEERGEISLGNNLLLDYAANQSLPFTVSVFDGKTIVEQAFIRAFH